MEHRFQIRIETIESEDNYFAPLLEKLLRL
jgi:hypothetical protein